MLQIIRKPANELQSSYGVIVQCVNIRRMKRKYDVIRILCLLRRVSGLVTRYRDFSGEGTCSGSGIVSYA